MNELTTESKINLHDEIAIHQLLPNNGLGPRLADSLRRAIYKEGCSTLDELIGLLLLTPDFPAKYQETVCKALRENCELDAMTLVRRIDSHEGETSHLVLQCHDGQNVETVIMRHRGGRNTVCVSSQAGCAMGCRFCATAALGFSRNLSYLEILGQVDQARRILKSEGRSLRNIVFMGMGEPLLNLDEVKTSVAILVDRRKYMFSRQHITISTCGIVSAIDSFAQDFPGLGMALSLHAPDDMVRADLMPVARRWPLNELMPAIDRFTASHQDAIIYEYLMIAGLTDQTGFDQRLVELLRGRPAKVNLIPYNRVEGRASNNFTSSPRSVIEAFRETLKAAGIPTTIRYTMGDNIQAACGQLAGKNQSAH